MPNSLLVTRCAASGKIPYASVEAAKRAIRGLSKQRRTRGRLHAYWCRICYRWHLGH